MDIVLDESKGIDGLMTVLTVGVEVVLLEDGGAAVTSGSCGVEEGTGEIRLDPEEEGRSSTAVSEA